VRTITLRSTLAVAAFGELDGDGAAPEGDSRCPLTDHLALHWHHFYDLSTTDVALTADGFFHAFGWFITAWGLFLLADLRRRAEVPWRRWVGAVVTGVGAFQLLDGSSSTRSSASTRSATAWTC